MEQRVQELSQRCVDTHAEADIWEHLEEELAELLLAIKRVRRGKEPFANLLEELIDVKIEINTVLTMIDQPRQVEEMLKTKLDKFERMLDADKINYPIMSAAKLVSRYRRIMF